MPQRYPFPKSAHMLKKSDYVRVFSQGEKIWGKHFICFVLVDAAMESRLGLVVSGKVGCAVVRNRVKRLVREFFRHNRGRFIPGIQLVVIGRVSSTTLDGRACAAELEHVLGRWFRHA